MLYQIYETQRSIMEPFSDLAQAASKLYSNPLNTMAQSPLSQRVAAGYALVHRLGKDYVKPECGIRSVKVHGSDVAIHERIEIDKLDARLVLSSQSQRFLRRVAADNPRTRERFAQRGDAP